MIPADLETWPAPAKLNLFLHITGRRPDGYHNLQTVFQLLDYCDDLAFRLRGDGKIDRPEGPVGVDVEHDLTVRAAKLLQQHTNSPQGVDIYIRKRLPMGGGLGGGSSNAATTLVALNYLWNCQLSTEMLAELGLRLGADVPVFIHGHSSWGEGVGELLTAVELPQQLFMVVRPDVEVKTEAIFTSAELTRDCKPITIADFLESGAGNVFESVVRRRYPEVADALDWLDRFATAKLTGTGSCIFAEFAEIDAAEAVLRQLPEGLSGFITRAVNQSPLLYRLQGETKSGRQ